MCRWLKSTDYQQLKKALDNFNVDGQAVGDPKHVLNRKLGRELRDLLELWEDLAGATARKLDAAKDLVCFLAPSVAIGTS